MRYWTFVATAVAVLAIGAQEFAAEAPSTTEPQDASAGAWAKDIGDRYLDAHVPDDSGGFVLVGSDQQVIGSDEDGWIVRVDANGNLTTQKRLGGPNGDALHCITQTSDGGWIAGGWTESYGSQHWDGDGWICKLDSTLKVQWQKRYRSTNKYRNERVLAILASSDGGYLALMFDESPYLMKLDSSGSVLWYKAYEIPTYGIGYVKSKLVQLTDGGIAVLGGEPWYSFNRDGFLFKVNSDGNLLWNHWIAGRSSEDESEELHALTATSDGGVVVGGYTTSYSDTGDGWLFKFDSGGNRLWEYRYKGSDSWLFTDAEELQDGSIILSGSYYSWAGDTRVVKVSSTGKLLWYKRYDMLDYWPEISITSDGSFAMHNEEGDDVVKFSSTGDLTAACKSTKWKLKTYKTTAAIYDPDITVTDQKMKKLNMNAKMYDTTETVTSNCH
ncbi:MAG: hypothetical protein HYX75_17985 [Acidobacteria bacterium]|nr:hypothetical protein [Acidobacteriota bacterium]